MNSAAVPTFNYGRDALCPFNISALGLKADS